MKLLNERAREYRILAIAIVFFLIGLFFFFYDQAQLSPQAQTAKVADTQHVVQPPEGKPINGTFASFSPPSSFQSFLYASGTFNGSSSFPIAATCNDDYLAVVVFPATVDYRSDEADAVYNRAFACGKGKAFQMALANTDMGTAVPGQYYVIVADEGTTGSWYNPR